MRSPQRTGTLVPTMRSTSQNEHSGELKVIPVRLVPAVSAAKWPLRPHRTLSAECGQVLAHRITNAHQAEASSLHAGRFLHGKQGIGDVGVVVAEHGVVESLRHADRVGPPSTSSTKGTDR